METLRRYIDRFIPSRREVTDEEAREAAVPLQPLFGLPLQPLEEDDLTPQPSFVTRGLPVAYGSSSLPPLILPAAAAGSSSASSSAVGTPMRRSPITTIRPLQVQPAASVGTPSMALVHEEPLTHENGNGTSSITISRGSDPHHDGNNNNNGNGNGIDLPPLPSNYHGLSLPLTRTVSSGVAASLWLPMVGRLGFFLFKLVVVGLCAITVFILLAALSGPWSYLQPSTKFLYHNTTVSSVSAWLLRVELCYPDRECEQISWQSSDPTICYRYNPLLFFLGLGGIGALAVSLFFVMLFLPFSARAIIRMHAQRRDICRFGLRPFAAGWAINGVCNAVAMFTWRWGCHQQLIDEHDSNSSSWGMTNEFYLCSSQTVGAVLVLGWVIAQRCRRDRYLRQRYEMSRLPNSTPMATIEPVALPTSSPLSSHSSNSSHSGTCILSASPPAAAASSSSSSPSPPLSSSSSSSTPPPTITSTASMPPTIAMMPIITTMVNDNNRAMDHDHSSTPTPTNASSSSSSSTATTTTVPSLPSRTVSESSSEDH